MDRMWKPVVGYENLYEVSNDGLIRSIDRYVKCDNSKYKNNSIKLRKSKVLKPYYVNGYQKVQLWRNNKKRNFRVHRLVAIAWIPNPYDLDTVDHIEPDKEDNTVSNLQWMSMEDNRIKRNKSTQ